VAHSLDPVFSGRSQAVFENDPPTVTCTSTFWSALSDSACGVTSARSQPVRLRKAMTYVQSGYVASERAAPPLNCGVHD
jgi:hypothetical protein